MDKQDGEKVQYRRLQQSDRAWARLEMMLDFCSHEWMDSLDIVAPLSGRYPIADDGREPTTL